MDKGRRGGEMKAEWDEEKEGAGAGMKNQKLVQIKERSIVIIGCVPSVGDIALSRCRQGQEEGQE